MNGLDYTTIIELAEPLARRRGYIGSLGIMRSLIPVATILLLLAGCGQRHALSPKERLAYGEFAPMLWDSYYKSNAIAKPPFCCIYVGLTAEEAPNFEDTFAHFSKSYGIWKVTKHYRASSGGPFANFMSAHVAFYVFAVSTTNISGSTLRELPGNREQALAGYYQSAFWTYALWTTNASCIEEGGHDKLAAYTGYIHMVCFDRQFAPKDFKTLAESLEHEVRKTWPNRAVEGTIVGVAKP